MRDDRASCSTEDGELLPLFFNPDDWAIEIAKDICSVCPIQTACLQAALDNHEPDGVWGGMTYTERRLFRRMYGPVVPEEIPELDLTKFLPGAGAVQDAA